MNNPDDVTRKVQDALRSVPVINDLASLRALREKASNGGWLVPSLYAALTIRMNVLYSESD